MSEEFERELAEDWESASDDLEQWELNEIAKDNEGAIGIGVSDAVEFGEE